MARFTLRRSIMVLPALAALLAGCAATPHDEVTGSPSARCVTRSANVYFEPWRSKPSREALRQLHSFQASFAGCRIDHVRIVGMAGAPGDPAANEQLSEKRAQFISDELALGGWNFDKFEVVAIGEQGATVDGVDKPMRRRAHIVVQASVP